MKEYFKNNSSEKHSSHTLNRTGLSHTDNRPVVTQLEAKTNTDQRKVYQLGKKNVKTKVAPVFGTDEYFKQKYDHMLNQALISSLKLRLKLLALKNRVEDDEDFKLVEEFLEELNEEKDFARRLRNGIRNKKVGRLRSADPRMKRKITLLQSFPNRFYHLEREVDAHFPTHSGGFGAKGRAHSMQAVANPDDPSGKQLDNSFVSTANVNGQKLVTENVFKPQIKVASEKAKRTVVAGMSLADFRRHEGTIQVIESRLSKINTPQRVSFTNTPVAKPRGDGQYANMANTNATGYAALINVPGWETQRWEWLHLRGAGLGGVTNSTNLVVGTRDANTHMIPFESNIRLLGKAVHENPAYRELDVEWSVANGSTHHAFSRINIRWILKHMNDSSKDSAGAVYFNPLKTNSNISKTEVQLLETKLKAVRDGL